MTLDGSGDGLCSTVYEVDKFKNFKLIASTKSQNSIEIFILLRLNF